MMYTLPLIAIFLLPAAWAQETVYGVYVGIFWSWTTISLAYHVQPDLPSPRRPHAKGYTSSKSNGPGVFAGLCKRWILPLALCLQHGFVES
jgi:hypothetical protein